MQTPHTYIHAYIYAYFHSQLRKLPPCYDDTVFAAPEDEAEDEDVLFFLLSLWFALIVWW